jgi:hypothetical protein
MSAMLITKNTALIEIQQKHGLTEIYRVEPTRLMQVVDLVLMQPPDTNRWKAYERLKKIASRFVGWNAEKDELRTTWHYEAILDFLGFLLQALEDYGANDP